MTPSANYPNAPLPGSAPAYWLEPPSSRVMVGIAIGVDDLRSRYMKSGRAGLPRPMSAHPNRTSMAMHRQAGSIRAERQSPSAAVSFPSHACRLSTQQGPGRVEGPTVPAPRRRGCGRRTCLPQIPSQTSSIAGGGLPSPPHMNPARNTWGQGAPLPGLQRSQRVRSP
jgi:hypothetical protein